MRFSKYEKLFLKEYIRVYYPKSKKITKKIMFEHMANYMLYQSVLGMFTGFLLGSQTMDYKKVNDLTVNFMSKVCKWKRDHGCSNLP